MAVKVSPPQLAQDLTLKQCQVYEQLVQSVLQRTAAQYASHLDANATLDPRAWKLMRTREKLQIYRSRERLQPNVFADADNENAPPTARYAPYSTLLAVGSVHGSLDDVMYGVVTPTQHAMETRSLLVRDDFKMHRVVQDIKLPTREEPFSYVGLKWVLRAAEVASIVRARDLVYIEASGFHTMMVRGREQRVGYSVCHSVELPELDARKKNLVRGRLSMCMLFRDRNSGGVDVYTTLISDPGGSVPPKLAAKSYARALIAISSAVDCAFLKKLSWLQKNHAANADGSCVALAKVQGSNFCCLQCTRNLSSFSSLITCGVCRSTVCSRCVATKKLVLGGTAQGLAYKPMQVCKGCITQALREVSASEVARDEFVLNRRRRDAQSIEMEWKTDEAAPPSPSYTLSSSDSRLGVDNIPEEAVMYSSSEEEDDDDLYECDFISPRTRPLELSELAEDEEAVEEIQPLPKSEVEKLRLMEQMNDLRIQAEETFRMTMRQTNTLQRSKQDVDARHDKRAFSKSAIY